MLKHNKIVECIREELCEGGAFDFELEQGKHYKLRWTMPDGRKGRLILPRSPSDPRGIKNTLSDVRRFLRGGHIYAKPGDVYES